MPHLDLDLSQFPHPVYFLVGWWDVNFNVLGQVLVYFSTAFSVWSAAVYFNAFLKMLGARGEPAA